MEQKNKELLLRDLCARLPYGVKVYNTTFKEPTIQTLYGKISSDEFLMEETYTSVGVDGDDFGSFSKRHYTGYIDFIKPYLRPMSSMTEDEVIELEDLFQKINAPCWIDPEYGCVNFVGGNDFIDTEIAEVYTDWLNKKMFDWRGLISMNLALEAPKEMYGI